MHIKFTKLYLPVSVCLFLFVAISAHAQTYWMQRGGSATIDEGLGVSVDDSANSYTTGYFTGTASFGAFNVTAIGISDIFVAKTNANGVYKWVVKAGDGGSDRGLAIKTDAKGNSYVTGYYYGTAHFGTFTVTSTGLQDVFIAKYNRNGVCKWVVSAGGTQADIGNAINVDAAGNVVVAGEFAGTATFGTYTLTSTANNVNVFTAKLDSANGNFLWAKSGVGPHTDRALGVACDQNNNVYVTGQFTDTITFGTAHHTNLYNAIFLVKYDASGNEKWFTYAGGGTFNIANGIDVDRNNNVYLTGDFTGTLTFFVTPNYNLTNTYTNRIFIAKYDANANLLWATSDGSNALVSSRAISVDSLGNAYIIGNFECKMNSYADQYGQGTFNTVGYWDNFAAQYSSGGTWQWSRQIGGHMNNYGNGIAVTHKGEVYITGSFDQDMIVPYNPVNFTGWNVSYNTGCNTVYCSDNNYGDYAYFSTAGNLDIFIAKPFDLSRQPYDYYVRTGAGCNRDFEGVCIDGPNCLDTVSFCSNGVVSAYSHTCNPIGPNFNYSWSNSQVGSAIIVTSTGSYVVTQTTADGCFSSKDTIYVKILPPPPKPNLSDNVVINTNSTNPQPIHICADSVRLWGGGYGSNSYNWSGGSTATTVSIEVTKSGNYCFNIKDSNGCTNQVCVTVTLDSALPNIKPKLKCISCKAPYYDTAFVCKGNPFSVLPYDSITNPTANPSKCIPPQGDVFNYWFASPSTVTYSSMTACGANSFSPQDSGWYQITDTIKLEDLCDTDKYIVHDSVFVRLYPLPVVGPMSITGGGSICPGDSVLLVAHDTAKFTWSTGSTQDSIWATHPGWYSITTTEINSYGCSASGSASILVNAKSTPTINITMSATTICPGDSLLLTCNGGTGGSTYQWYGPSGPFGGNTSTIWVTTPGIYYCINTDTNYCNPSLSNSVIVNSYATPYLSLPRNGLLCAGDSVKVQVNASPGATIIWQAPLSGGDSVMYIKNAGTYTCKIVSCGITTVASITVVKDNPFAQITTKTGKEFCQGDSVILKGNNGMMNYSWSPGGSTSQSITVKTAGIYTLTTTDSSGCRALDTVHVQVNDYSVAPAITSDTSVCIGTPVTLYASGTGNILWYDSVGGPIVGTGSPYIVNFVDSGMTFYVVVDEGGCLSAVKKVNVTIADCGDLYVPNIFTPNGDGNNDIWHVTFPGAKCFHVEIFNRWGVKVFESNSVSAGWNGKIMQTGMDASDGVYYFILNYCNYLGQTGTDHGFIQLIR